MIDIAAFIALSIAQALAASGVPPTGELTSTAVVSVDDLGGPPTAPPMTTRVRSFHFIDVISVVATLAFLGSVFYFGVQFGLMLAKKKEGGRP